MLAKRVIPCLDVDAGRVVKGVRFQDLRDAGDPVELAARYDADGADELVFLDITATVEARGATLDVISRTAEQVFIPLTVGGRRPHRGRRPDAAAGGRRQGLAEQRRGSRPRAALAVRGPLRRPVRRDRDRREGGRRPAAGGCSSTRAARPPGRDVVEWADEATSERGAGEILLTSMDRDGTGEGYDLDLLDAVATATNVPLIASGGAGEVRHFADGLRVADAVLAASRFHDGDLSIAQVKDALADAGIAVRR